MILSTPLKISLLKHITFADDNLYESLNKILKLSIIDVNSSQDKIDYEKFFLEKTPYTFEEKGAYDTITSYTTMIKSLIEHPNRYDFNLQNKFNSVSSLLDEIKLNLPKPSLLLMMLGYLKKHSIQPNNITKKNKDKNKIDRL